jgi:hypothetical protein
MNTSLDLDDIDDMLPSRMLAEPSRAITPRAPSDPARLGYPPTFPIEIALRTSGTRQICEEYGIDEDEWDLIRVEPLFLEDLRRALDMLKQEGMSFKVKARLQSEEILKTNWRLVHDASTPPAVRAQQINSIVRWAGYDTPSKENNGVSGSGFQININFAGSAPVPRVITSE